MPLLMCKMMAKLFWGYLFNTLHIRAILTLFEFFFFFLSLFLRAKDAWADRDKHFPEGTAFRGTLGQTRFSHVSLSVDRPNYRWQGGPMDRWRWYQLIRQPQTVPLAQEKAPSPQGLTQHRRLVVVRQLLKDRKRPCSSCALCIQRSSTHERLWLGWHW